MEPWILAGILEKLEKIQPPVNNFLHRRIIPSFFGIQKHHTCPMGGSSGRDRGISLFVGLLPCCSKADGFVPQGLVRFW